MLMSECTPWLVPSKQIVRGLCERSISFSVSNLRDPVNDPQYEFYTCRLTGTGSCLFSAIKRSMSVCTLPLCRRPPIFLTDISGEWWSPSW